MKQKGIILSLIGIVIVSTVLMITVNQNTKKVIMQDGAMLALTLDGSSITEFPSSTNYRVEIDCTNGRGKVLPEDGTWKFSVDNIEGNIKCNIDFYSKTENDKLTNKIASLVGTFTPGSIMEQEDYSLIDNDPDFPWIWNDSDKSWTSSNKGDEAADTLSFMTFSLDLEGYFQMCYKQSSESGYGGFAVYTDDADLIYTEEPTANYKCENLGHLSYDTIYVENYSGGNDEVSFYIQSLSNNLVHESIDAGYRYEGTNPNNYIWFNNEMWRIIGSIPTKVDASDTATNLVKIIRKDSLGEILYDGKYSGYTGAWGSNTLYTLLNSYYYGKKDGTNTEYCYGSFKNGGGKTIQKCDYTANGISSDSTDYYGRMVKNVYWNTGTSVPETTANVVYANEKVTQTVQGRIGLMSASDYGYAAGSVNHDSTNLSSYDTSYITLSNWLFSQGSEWTNTHSSSNADKAFFVYEHGDVLASSANIGRVIRPVVYLNENVYVISGSGTEADPYIIGM